MLSGFANRCQDEEETQDPLLGSVNAAARDVWEDEDEKIKTPITESPTLSSEEERKIN